MNTPVLVGILSINAETSIMMFSSSFTIAKVCYTQRTAR